MGVGTTAPTSKLHVVGDLRITGGVAIDAGQRYYFNGQGGSRYFADDATNNRITISSALFMNNQTILGAFQIRGFNDQWVLENGGNIRAKGNLLIRRNGSDTDPTLMYLGREEDQGGVPAYTNYLFWQNRLNQNG